LQTLVIALITGYRRFLSPALHAISGPRCRFHPSCSEYAIEAVRTRGVVVGLALALWRVLRCQPFAKGGHDPVPARPARPGAMSA
jgi:putative membrane protein insertion efficiency factor